MAVEEKICHGQYECMLQSSSAIKFEKLHRILWRLRAAFAHLLWHLKTKGLTGTLKLTAFKILGVEYRGNYTGVNGGGVAEYQEVLNLQPGELVEVKSEAEIAATLDANRRNKGLYFMGNMRRFCGGKYRVFKRLENIILESDGQLRKIKNTVLLENVYCGGTEHYGCDRSCFHYWREAWLKRVNDR